MGTGFQNPIRTGTTAVLNGLVIPGIPELTVMANAQALLKGVSPPSTNQIETAQASITEAYNKTQSLLGHSDRISGVNLSGDNTIAAIARTMQTAKTVNGENTCSTVLKAFGAIQKAAEMVTDVVTTINAIKSFLEDIPGAIDSIPGICAAYATKIGIQVANDVAALVQAQVDNLHHAVAQNIASLFSDPCIGQIMGTVLTADMHSEVSKAVTAAKNDSIKAISGSLHV